MCAAVSAVERVDVISGGHGSFRLPKSNYGTSNVYHHFASGRYPYWRQSLPIRGKCTVFPPFSLRVTPSLSPAYVWPLSAKDGSKMSLELNSGACATSCSFRASTRCQSKELR